MLYIFCILIFIILHGLPFFVLINYTLIKQHAFNFIDFFTFLEVNEYKQCCLRFTYHTFKSCKHKNMKKIKITLYKIVFYLNKKDTIFII